MWGSWFSVTLSFVAAALLVILGAATAFTPIFAVGIAAVVIGLIGVYFVVQRGRAHQEGDAEAGASDDVARSADEPEHSPRDRRGSELTGGIWGERREA